MVALITTDDLRAAVADASVVAPVGSKTHWEVGGPPPEGSEVTFVAAPDGISTYDPADLTARRILFRCALEDRDLPAARAECRALLAFDPPDADLFRRWLDGAH